MSGEINPKVKAALGIKENPGPDFLRHFQPAPEYVKWSGIDAQQKGEINVSVISERVAANEPERETIAKFERLVRHGVSAIDIKVRVDGKDYQFEGDWLARLFR